MGTPIINLPQTAVLGLHAIKDKPVAVNGRVEIRPVSAMFTFLIPSSMRFLMQPICERRRREQNMRLIDVE